MTSQRYHLAEIITIPSLFFFGKLPTKVIIKPHPLYAKEAPEMGMHIYDIFYHSRPKLKSSLVE